jgi:hypothetical protein
MTPLGKPLVFHLKYMVEMNRLFDHRKEGEEADLTGLDNAEQIREMVRAVGVVSYEQATDFLCKCGKAIEARFANLGIETVVRTKSRAYIRRHWLTEVKVQVTSVPGAVFNCGVWITAPPGNSHHTARNCLRRGCTLRLYRGCRSQIGGGDLAYSRRLARVCWG